MGLFHNVCICMLQLFRKLVVLPICIHFTKSCFLLLTKVIKLISSISWNVAYKTDYQKKGKK